MSKTKKGFYFTIVTLFCIMLLLLLSFENRNTISSDALRSRILTADNFVKSIERDASRAVYISSYRTMVAVVDYVTVSHDYLDEYDSQVNDVFADALFNGSLNHSLGFEEAEGLLVNSTLKDWQNHTKKLSEAVGLNISFVDPNPSELRVYQKDPWFVDVSIPIKYNLSDPISGVRWTRNTNVTASIPIVNTFEDPFYVINFGQGCGNKILKNSSPVITEPTECSMTAFLDSWGGAGSRYISSVRAPSFLNRLKGNLSGFRAGTDIDPYGIESLIDTSRVSICLQTPVNTSTTVVDFRYESTGEDELHFINTVPRIRLSLPDDIRNYSIPSGCYA